jgi:PIN domain nuclease of toxin-antitoxin system
MKYLLDTHTFIWWHDRPAALSPKIMEICQNINNQLWFSLASVWEIQIKLQINKLTLDTPLADILTLQQQNGLQLLPITVPHILELQTLPLYHKDPFDRLLIAQTRVEKAVLLSKDAKFQPYPVTTLW